MGRYALSRLRASDSELEPVTEVNIIPVIDISLVLLVILFVTAPLLSYPNLPIELPKARGQEDQGRAVHVTLTAEGRLAVGSRDADWERLGALLGEELGKGAKTPVVLRVDRSVPYSSVERLIAAAKGAGAGSVSLGTEPPR
ncbi:MAG: biopolymer transporter ExbD [Elusimicrobia bacterium]|nr:biopolymer transporter ExbD [Elusimicrobiota bacterium]